MNNNICSKKCMGYEGYDGRCCTIEDRDFIIGPHLDTDSFLRELRDKYGQTFLFEEVFYSYEEGKGVFPDRPTWQKQSSYPALRVNLEHVRSPCIFYNTFLRVCTVYELRQEVCRTYTCAYLRENEEEK